MNLIHHDDGKQRWQSHEVGYANLCALNKSEKEHGTNEKK